MKITYYDLSIQSPVIAEHLLLELLAVPTNSISTYCSPIALAQSLSQKTEDTLLFSMPLYTLHQQKLHSLVPENQTLLIQNGKTLFRIYCDNIKYLESQGRITFIHTYEETFQTYEKLSGILLRLPQQFFQCHKSYIVNMDFIQQLNRTHCTLTTTEYIPISRRHQNEFPTIYKQYHRQNSITIVK